jgi:glucan phosphoethanolaminetransferase (alkaline phosphatase superfamily)
LAFVTITTIVVWSCALAWQVNFDPHATDKDALHRQRVPLQGRALLFLCVFLLLQMRVFAERCIVFFGDACYQALAYWIMGAISNDPFTLARFTGFYKAIQSAGGAGSFGMDATSTPFLNENLASWCLMLASFPLAGIVIWGIKDTSYTEEKTVYASDVRSDFFVYWFAHVIEYHLCTI